MTTDPAMKWGFRRLLSLLIVLGPALVFLAWVLGLLVMFFVVGER